MKIIEEFSLENHNGYRFKSYCSKAYIAEDDSDIIKFFSEIRSNYIILGAGFNTILSKDYYSDPVLIVFPSNRIQFKEETVQAYAGVSLMELSLACYKQHLSGMEFLYDIPGSIGGAIYMNAGNDQKDISSLVDRIEYYDVTQNQIKIISKDQAEFEYRTSIFQQTRDLIITRVQFQLNHGNAAEIANKMLELKNIRWEKQPRHFPNCGSVFKRPEGKFVGPLLEKIGLKGTSVGGMKVSDKHAGFIINFNNGNANDLLTLIELIQDRVMNEYDIDLELEQRII